MPGGVYGALVGTPGGIAELALLDDEGEPDEVAGLAKIESGEPEQVADPAWAKLAGSVPSKIWWAFCQCRVNFLRAAPCRPSRSIGSRPLSPA